MDPSATRSVLIVEDSESIAATLEIALLSVPGIQVLLATSGLTALSIIGRSEPKLYAVITDLNMPHMDGFDLIRHIRADPRHSQTPIIVVSADPDPETPGRVARSGANAFFPKPYSPALLRRKLEELLDAPRP